MLDYLRGRSSDRKLRLFSAACCRQAWRWIKEPYHRLAVEAAEDFADGRITVDDLQKARAAAWASEASNRREGVYAAARAVATTSAGAAARQAQRHVVHTLFRANIVRFDMEAGRKRAIQRQQCDLLRDILGNLFRSVSVKPAWLVWNDGTTVKIAEAIYEGHAFDRLPILADALEDAGCDNADLLAHCRRPGPHVRGCWVIDLLLGMN
jgi:hypothetical protein